MAAVVAVFSLMLGEVSRLLDFFEELASRGGLGAELLSPLYKTIGVALVVKIGGGICRDAGETAVASALEIAGAVCALLVSLPLLRTVLMTLTELMNG